MANYENGINGEIGIIGTDKTLNDIVNTNNFKVLFDGKISATALGNSVNVPINAKISDYDLFVLTLGTSGAEVVNIVLSKYYLSGIFELYALSMYKSYGFVTDNSNNTSFNFVVREIYGWNITEISMFKIVGIKI